MQIISDSGLVAPDPNFRDEVIRTSGQEVELCYQCQKCASGCPVAEHFDYTPNQVIRLVLFGLRREALGSPAIWLCAGCETCGARCPNGIRISDVMDTLKEMAAAEGVRPGEPNTAAFHQLFLGEVRSRGRVFETMLIARYKLRTRQLFSDLDLGRRLFFKGKLPLLPRNVRDRKGIRKIFDKGARHLTY